MGQTLLFVTMTKTVSLGEMSVRWIVIQTRNLPSGKMGNSRTGSAEGTQDPRDPHARLPLLDSLARQNAP